MDRQRLPTSVDERYRVIEQIGVGGHAAVYRAAGRTDLSMRVAIKVLHTPVSDDERRRRFLRECNVLRRLRPDDRVVSLIEHGIDGDGRAFMVMPLYDGTWAERLASQGRIAPGVVERIAHDVATALDAAHRAGVIHRDVKPSNMFLDADQRTVLGDFGAAGLVDSTTLTSSLAMSIPFAAPEVLETGDASPASDLYALGASLSQLLTGELPFGGSIESVGDTAGISALIDRIAHDDPPELHGVDTRLAHVVHSLLAKRPADRPASAAEMISMLSSNAPVGPAGSRRRSGWVPVAASVAAVACIGGLTLAGSGSEATGVFAALGTNSGRAQPAAAAPVAGESPVRSEFPDFSPVVSTTRQPAATPIDAPSEATSPASRVRTTSTDETNRSDEAESGADGSVETRDSGLVDAVERGDAEASSPSPITQARESTMPEPPGPQLPPDPVVTTVPTITTTSTSSTTTSSTTTTSTTEPPAEQFAGNGCNGARACENFDAGIAAWTIDADEGAGRISTSQREAFSGADSLGAIPSDTATEGSLAVRRVFGVDQNADDVHFRFRLQLGVDGATDYWGSVFVARDLSSRVWRVNIRDVDDGATFGLWTDDSSGDGYGGGSSAKTIEYRRWHCIDFVVSPGSQDPAVLSVDGVEVARIAGPPAGAVAPEYEVFLGLPALREPATAPDVFFDDFEIDPTGSC